jgi:two-component system, chemotaxis family, chemotaxis protein CheY
MESKTQHFIVIDDDPVSNNISKMYLRKMFPDASIKTFTDPQEGLDYILAHFEDPNADKAALFLDINMPFLSGWDILDRFVNTSDLTKLQFKIYMNTSSLAPKDRKRALQNPFVAGYIEKPLTMLKLKNALSPVSIPQNP